MWRKHDVMRRQACPCNVSGAKLAPQARSWLVVGLSNQPGESTTPAIKTITLIAISEKVTTGECLRALAAPIVWLSGCSESAPTSGVRSDMMDSPWNKGGLKILSK